VGGGGAGEAGENTWGLMGFLPPPLHCISSFIARRIRTRSSSHIRSNMNSIELWKSLVQRAGFTLADDAIAQLNKYLDLLLAANERMNLTRITDRTSAELLHIADAMTLLPFLPPTLHKLADIGSGGGVPGIVLAILRPDAQVVLIESTAKKAAFLTSTAQELGLKNVTIDARRAENIAHTEARESFDTAVARAVGLLPVLVEWLLPLVKPGGCVLAMKGPKAAQELREAQHAIKLLGGGPAELFPANLPEGLGHLIIRIPKIARTPGRFPRDPSVAKHKRI
jgi:16S rRNA (guanine527-N7)-methyltransferase